jgi:hypothetical protein
MRPFVDAGGAGPTATLKRRVLRVYLDQNHWVSLTKARVERDDGAPFADVLLLLREAVDRGWVSLPLSIEHCMEVQHRHDYASRTQLAETMLELSQLHTIRLHKDLQAAEIDRALQQTFGRPAFPRETQVFGVGMNHAFGRDIINYTVPAESEMPAELRATIQARIRKAMEVVILVGAPPDFEAEGYDPSAHRQVGVNFATEQERLRSIRRPEGYHRGDAGRRAASVDTFTEFQDPISEALKLAGLHWGYVYDLEREGMEALLRAIPTVFVHRELRHLRHEASPKAWEENDLADIAALSVAIVYCDIVVTERVWTHLAARAKLGGQFNTVILRDLESLVPHLLGAAEAA